MPSADALAILDALKEPALVLELSGKIVAANRAAGRILGSDAAGRDVSCFVAGPKDGFSTYLRRCSGTTDILPGSVVITCADGTQAKFRTAGSLLRNTGHGTACIALRLLRPETNEFSILARKIRDLNFEIGQRRRTQAALEEALRQNETLLRELQHRVKNNLQMLIGLFSAARRETQFEEVRAFLDEVAHRLMAVIAAHQLMYQSQDVHAVEAASFVKSLSAAIAMSYENDVRLEVCAFDGHIANDVVFPFALIMNELLTNAYKYGANGAGSRILVDLRRDETSYTLIVHDNGPGISGDVKERRSSGLGLVRGLCRQIGGSLMIENSNGARCTVRVSSG
jgi:two-component sensor histidine kinase